MCRSHRSRHITFQTDTPYRPFSGQILAQPRRYGGGEHTSSIWSCATSAVDLSKFDVKQYPDYRPGQPPDLLKIAGASYLDEFESVWGRQWGAMGIGRLREVGLSRPVHWETEDFFTQDENFFLLRFSGKLNF